ncbi:MAG TPA: protein kinase [Kofleriaceae bacterium]|nr:protein kinase [Kofleriaceae bacterium]
MRVCVACRRLLRADQGQCPDDQGAAELVATLPPGTRIGPYRIEGVLGEGGMGFVYEATHVELKRRAAIKMLRNELSKIEQIVTRFLNEAKAVNLIAHQNIISIYDYGDGGDGSVYFVMEFLEGQTFEELMHKRQPMAVPLLVHLFTQIGKALAAAHQKKIVHRDLKPANVFVIAREDNPYFVKLLDFGIAQLRGEGAVQGLTLAGSVMGTPQYMSPEQISGDTVDARTDVWALGVMLYRAATGQAPFRGEVFVELADKIFHHAPIPASQLVPMPPALAQLIASCLERRVEERCPSVSDFLAALELVKAECGLDDEKLLAAVRADFGAGVMGFSEAASEPTHGELGESLPQFQVGSDTAADAVARLGAQPPEVAPAPGAAQPPRRSRLGLYMTLGALVGGLGSAGLVLLGGGEPEAGTLRAPGPAPDEPRPPGPDRIEDLQTAFREGGLAKVRARVEQHLRETIAAGTLQAQGFAVDALGMARVTAGAKLLYIALKKQPDVRSKAARALGELGLPDAAPKVREALGASGGRVKNELAATLARLGDKDSHAILKRNLGEQSLKIDAALALAESGEGAGRAVLTETVDALPPGNEQWRRAAGGLLQLGDARARELLAGELAQPDAARSVPAAELLARAGDAKAREQLARNADDADFARQGEAAAALARLGDPRALGWVPGGLRSRDVDERKLALAVCGALAAHAAAHTAAIVQIADGDPDLSTRMTAEAVLLGL